MRVLLLRTSLILIFVFCNSCFLKNKKQSLLINGAGASFPYMLYSKWLLEYRRVDPGVFINYQSIGSGGGIRQMLAGTLDFGATDTPLTKEDQKSTKKQLLHIPTSLGAVILSYNLNIDSKKPLRLSGSVISQIFRGKITRWNHKKIQELNPKTSLTNQNIIVIYRADSSGTTSFFTKYLSLKSPAFLKQLGYGKLVSWPVGVGGKGNEGVMSLLNQIKGSIAYLGMSYAASQKLPMIQIDNALGEFVTASSKSVRQAAHIAIQKKYKITKSFINIKGKQAYPLSGFTYILVNKTMPKKKGKALVAFLKWALQAGQKMSQKLHFIFLPQSVRKKALQTLNQVQFIQVKH